MASSIESALKEEISRLAERELQSVAGPIVESIQKLRANLDKLEAALGGIGKSGRPRTRRGRKAGAPSKAAGQRFTPRQIRSMRKKFAFSQQQMAAALGVSAGAVQTWEQGRSRPRGRNLEALTELMNMSQEEAKARVEAATGRKVGKRRRRKKTS